MIDFFAEDVDMPSFSEDKAQHIISEILNDHSLELEFASIVFCSDEYLLKINKEYLEHDYYTDIITFDYTDSDIPSSDIFISIDRVADNANTFRKPFINELYRIIFHGILHLVGYKDKEPDDKLLMTQKEDHYLTILQDSE